MGWVRSAWGVRSVARLRLFTELPEVFPPPVLRALLLPFLALFGGLGEDLEEPTPSGQGRVLFPPHSVLFSFHIASVFPRWIFLFSGGSCRWRDLSVWTQGIDSLVDIRGEGLLFEWGKINFLMGAELWSVYLE